MRWAYITINFYSTVDSILSCDHTLHWIVFKIDKIIIGLQIIGWCLKYINRAQFIFEFGCQNCLEIQCKLRVHICNVNQMKSNIAS